MTFTFGRDRPVLDTGLMDFEKLLLSLGIVLLVAAIASELFERLKQPSVLGEIMAGIAIGPSVLGLVQGNDVLGAIAELGAVLLLFEVGMHMNLSQLGRVGSDSLRVAVIGIALPMILVFFTSRALGVSPEISLFLAGALTATSVGITARVFGDLRALATPEARTVLGAAVADDVAGLLILTTVTALSSGGDVDPGSMARLIGTALAFVILVTAVAAWAAPALFRQITTRTRTSGTTMALALVFVFAVALAASAVHLAPIVGAFIAGLALSRTEARDELQRRLNPLVNVFVPVFFVMIGVETNLGVFTRPSVLGLAAILTVVAIAGKVLSGLGVRRGHASKLLVGVAMAPRGEVGLIFAGIGLAAGTLDAGFYGVLVAVVLATTLVTPPWVRHLVHRARTRTVALSSSVAEPAGGWLTVTPEEVELRSEPPDLLAGRLGFGAAVLCSSRQPGPWLLQWLSSAENHSPKWDEDLRRSFFDLLREGNGRSWRFLQVTGLLDSWLPELGEAARNRQRDPFNLEPGGDLTWELLEDLRALVYRARSNHPDDDDDLKRVSLVWTRLEEKELVLLAALSVDAFGDAAATRIRKLAGSLALAEESTSLLEFLVAEHKLLIAAARRLDSTGEDTVLELASHIVERRRADALFLLAAASGSLTSWERDRLFELYELVQGAMAYPELAGSASATPVDFKRRQIRSMLLHFPPEQVDNHLRLAPRRYLVAHGPEVIARHLKMTAAPFGRTEVRLEAEPSSQKGLWTVHVAAQDRKGLLAAIAGAFSSAAISVEEAFVSTWADGGAIDVFKVIAPRDTDWAAIQNKIEDPSIHGGNGAAAEAVEGTIDIDNVASPWHTIVEIRAYDRRGLLYRVASALSSADLQIHMALVRTEAEVAVDVFYVTGPSGGKLDQQGEQTLRLALSGALPRRWRAAQKSLRQPKFTKGKHPR